MNELRIKKILDDWDGDFIDKKEALDRLLALFPSEPKNRLERPLSCEDCSIDAELSSARDGNTFQKKRYYSLKARMEVGEIAKAIYYSENPQFRQYPETSWENYPSEDKPGYFKAATAIIKYLKGEKI